MCIITIPLAHRFCPPRCFLATQQSQLLQSGLGQFISRLAFRDGGSIVRAQRHVTPLSDLVDSGLVLDLVGTSRAPAAYVSQHVRYLLIFPAEIDHLSARARSKALTTTRPSSSHSVWA